MSDATGPVLIVEDDPDNRTLLRLRVARHHHDVVEAGSGEEALDLARDRTPALILLDIHLPGIDGWELIDRLLADPVLREVPVLVVTIQDQPGDVPRPPVAGYLTKPYRAADVDRALRALLGNGSAPAKPPTVPEGGP